MLIGKSLLGRLRAEFCIRYLCVELGLMAIYRDGFSYLPTHSQRLCKISHFFLSSPPCLCSQMKKITNSEDAHAVMTKHSFLIYERERERETNGFLEVIVTQISTSPLSQWLFRSKSNNEIRYCNQL
jgi:hypothetical protein